MRALSIFIIVALLLCMAVVPAIAQESTPEPVPTEPVEPPVEEPEPLPDIPVMPVEEAAELLIATIITILVGLADSPLTTGIVALLKRVPALDFVSAKVLQFVVAAVIAALWWVSSALGYGPQLQSVYAFLLTLVPALSGLLARQIGSAAWYKAAKKADIGVFSYQRPLDRTLQAQG